MPLRNAECRMLNAECTRLVEESLRLQRDEGGAEVTARVVSERDDERMRGQHLMHACALHADAPTVHQSHVPQAALDGGLEIRIDHVGDVAWCERMQVELGPDGDDVGAIHGNAECRMPSQSFVYVAVTVVRMPPRGVKSPITVMRIGAHDATRSSRIWLVSAS